jgi:hypothetical protein
VPCAESSARVLVVTMFLVLGTPHLGAESSAIYLLVTTASVLGTPRL